MAAEYIVSSGNPNVILCERGIRTFETYTRNTMDLAAVPLLHHLTHLPVIVDPSHATGKRWLVKPLALGGVAVGADGVMVEVHPDPDAALSDAEQQLTLDQFRDAHGRARARSTSTSAALHGDPVLAGCRARASAGPAPGSRSTGAADDRRRPRPRPLVVRPAARLRGELALPGDKSISHRALMLATLAAGESRIERRGRRRGRPLDGGDLSPRSGADVERLDATTRRATPRLPSSSSPGVDGLREPAADLDCGNSGTSLRLFAGILAGLPLPERPRRRRFVATPSGRSYHRAAALDGRGARTRRSNDSLPPLTVIGRTPLRAVDSVDARPERPGEVGDPPGRRSGPTAGRRSARRSRRAITRSGCSGRAASSVRDAAPTARPAVARAISLEGGRTVQAIDERVPGDVSAAAFWLVAGAIHPDAELTLRGVGVNPTRRAVIDLLRRDGRRHRASGRRAAADGAGASTSASRSPTSASARPSSAAIDLGPGRRRRRDRRDPDPLPGRRPRARHDHDPRRRRAAPQGVGPDRRHRRPASRALGARHRRRRRRPARSTAGQPLARRADRQPRRPPPRDDVRDRRPRRRRRDDGRPARPAPRSPTPASSPISKGSRS